MPDRTLTVFRTARVADRAELAGWQIRSVVLGEQIALPEASGMLEQKILDCDSLLVTSPRAAAWIANQALPKFVRKPVFVAGESTAKPLEESHWDVRVPNGTGGEAATRLLAEQGFLRPLFLCATETAGTVESTGSELGLDLRSLAIYHTLRRADWDAHELPELDQTEFVAFMAPSAVRFLLELAPGYFESLRTKCPAVVASESIHRTLRQALWSDIRLASGPSLSQLVQSFGGL